MLILADRQGGKVLGISLWEGEESMGASEEAAYWFRTYSAEAASERVTNVERYEVFFSSIQEAQLSERAGESRSTEAKRPSGTSGRAG